MTATTATGLFPAGTPAVQTGRSVRARIKADIIANLRIPVAVISSVAFPVMSFAFFAVPQSTVRSEPLTGLSAVCQLAVFSVMSTFLFNYGVGIAEERANPWSQYLRTLASGPGALIGGRVAVAVLFGVFGLLPLLLAGGLLTNLLDAFGGGGLSWWRLPLGLGALVLAGLPFIGMGLSIGYGMRQKAAVAVAQVLLLPLAFLGGLFLPPSMFPGWLDAVSEGTPTRAARDFVVGTVTGEPLVASTIAVLIGWSIALLGLAGWAYRKDEGDRYH